jgi:integrase
MEHLAKDEIRSLLSVAKGFSERDYLMILVGYSHGLRASEVVGIKAQDIQDGCLTVARLKGSLKTTQPLVSSEGKLLDEASALPKFAFDFHPNQRLFPVNRKHFWKLVSMYGKRAGLPKRKCHPHILKHSIAIQIIHSAGIKNARQYLGQKSPSSTHAYLKADDDGVEGDRRRPRATSAV